MQRSTQALVPRLLAALLLPALALAVPPVPAPEPPALPALTDPASLHAVLAAEAREVLDQRLQVVTFAEVETETPEGLTVEAVSLGTLLLPPSAVTAVLQRTQEYPTWVPLNPSYKEARMRGPGRMECSVGKADARRGQRQLTYDVDSSAATTTWTLAHASGTLLPGSFLSFEVAPHPTLEGATLLVHRQRVLLPDTGRMTKYLTSDDDRGRNRFWKDASKHARRTHWAIDAAAREAPGPSRERQYLDSYQREFPASLPWWAQ